MIKQKKKEQQFPATQVLAHLAYATALLTHEDLEKCVGDAISSFVIQMLTSDIPPGVYFPEEIPRKKFRTSILNEISSDAISYCIFQSK